uniref:Uncharacterized protein n=1 Tax=Vespula pensylvanica TaxID=30213 RepID=A0A834NYJ9_VESPE|nr:hypothetical protein H0235_009289 [Vespula pensylvanica]
MQSIMPFTNQYLDIINFNGDSIRPRIRRAPSAKLVDYAREQQFPVQLCFGLRRGNLEIFAVAIPANFDFALSEDFDNLSPRMDLEIFTDAIFANINEQLIEIYNSFFDFRLKCEFPVQLCFGLRQENLEIFVDAIHFSVQLCFGLRQENLEIFADAIHFSVQLCFGLRRVNLEIFSLWRDLEIFALSKDFENLSSRGNLEIFVFPEDFENLSPRVNLEIFTLPEDFEILSSRGDLEIFALSRDFDNLSPRVDLEIFADVIRASINEDFNVLEPSQNFLSSKLIFKSLRSLNHAEDERSESARLQQPPRGGTWVGSTCVISKSHGVQGTDILVWFDSYPLLNANTGRIERTLTPVSAGTGVVFSGANKSLTRHLLLQYPHCFECTTTSGVVCRNSSACVDKCSYSCVCRTLLYTTCRYSNKEASVMVPVVWFLGQYGRCGLHVAMLLLSVAYVM